MKLVKLQVTNFMSIGAIDLNLDQPGMNLILGKNLDDKRFDSNGSAKSALFEAMTWGLFGQFIRELTAPEFIRLGTDRMQVAVLVDPEDGSERVWIIRSRTKRDHIVTVQTEAGTPLFPANSVKDIQPQIDSWLGLDFRTFTNSVYFGKGLVKFFMSSNDTERKDLLETILQLVSFDDALERAKALSKKCVEDTEQQQMAIVVNAALKSEKLNTIEDLEKQISDIVKEINDAESVYIKKLDTLTVDRAKLQNSQDRLDILIITKKKEFDEEYGKINAEHEEKTNQIEEALNKEILSTQSNFIKAITETKQKQKIVTDGIQKAFDELANIQTFFLRKSVDIEKEIAKVAGKTESINNDKKHAMSLSENSLCKECLQSVTPEHKQSLLDKYDKELYSLVEQLTDLDNQLGENNIGLMAKYTKPYLDLLTKKETILGVHNVTLEAMQQENRVAIENLHKKATQEKMKISKGYLDKLRVLQEEHEKDLTKWLKTKSDYKLDIMLIDKELTTLARVRLERQAAWSKLKDQLKLAEEALIKINKAHEFAEDKIEAISIIKNKTDFWIEGFGPRGIKSFVFESALPYLTTRTNHYSSYLTGGTVTIDIAPTTVVKSTGSVKEKLTVSAFNKLGANVYSGNSDGERRRIDICILLALQDLISTRASKSWNTLIFDEVMDSLDNTGIEHVIELFRTFENKSIFIISHNAEIKRLFDTCINVIKKDGVSFLEENLFQM